LTYIGNSTSLFNLDSNTNNYLNDLGVPTAIINAMMQRDQQLQQMGVAAGAPSTPPADTTETAATQPAEVPVNYFYDTLTPYGRWVDVAGYGWCWRPTVVVSNPGWQPYCDDGHWVYTDSGWYWISGYSWGWATFHYGRWFQMPRYGWCWWPDTTWAPSWVCWRYDKDYCGWAPLPPHAVYQSGVGFLYDGHKVSAGFNFGLSVGAFTFVATRDFCDPQPWRHRIEERERARIYDRTTVIQNIDFDSHRHGIVNAGIPLHNITAVTRQEIHPVTIRDEDQSAGRGDRREQFERDGRTLIVNRPHFVGTPVLSSHPGTTPTTEHRQNEVHPIVHGNENNVSPHLGNPVQNNFPHPEANQNPHPNSNRVTPQTPQTQQPEVPHVTTPNSPGHNHAITTPPGNVPAWPAQNQTPNAHYSSGNRIISPRAQGLEQPPTRGATYNPQPRGNTTVQQPFSSPPVANHYSPPAAPPQNNYSPPPNASHNNDQHFNHSEPPPQAVQPHASNQSSSSSSPQSNKEGQDKDNNQRGH